MKPKTQKAPKLPEKPEKPAKGQLEIVRDDSKTVERQFADVAVEGIAGDALMVMGFTERMFGQAAGDNPPSVGDYAKSLRDQIARVNGGDMAQMEAMLVGQATALSSIFRECARMSLLNMREYPEATERYLRLAMKAQSQCRTTIETLSEIKNPRQTVFAKQANIGHNQQVNNDSQPVVRAEIVETTPNELRAIEHEPSMDAGATSAQARRNPQGETVVAIDRAKNAGRKRAR